MAIVYRKPVNMSLLLRMSFLPWQNLLIITFSCTFQNKCEQWQPMEFWLGHYFVWLFRKTMAKLFWLHSISSMETKNSLPCTLHTDNCILWRCRVIMSTKCQKYYGEMLCDRGIWCALCIILCNIYYCVALCRCHCCCLRLNVPSHVCQYRRVEWILVFYALHLSVFLHIALHHELKCHAKRIQCIFQLEWVHSSQIHIAHTFTSTLQCNTTPSLTTNAALSPPSAHFGFDSHRTCILIS